MVREKQNILTSQPCLHTLRETRTLTGSHSRQCEYTAHVFTSVRSGRQNATFEVQNRTRDSSTRKLGKNYLVISDMVVKLLALFPFTFFAIIFFEVPIWGTRLSHLKVSSLRRW